MKLAIIGGAGVRVPLLVGGFARSTLHVDRIDLYDIDQPRLAVIADLAAAHGAGIAGARARHRRSRASTARTSSSPASASAASRQRAQGRGDGDRARRGRPGDGRPGRVRHGHPHDSGDGRVRRGSPRGSRRTAWLINFTNPVSVVIAGRAAAQRRADHRHLRHADRDLRGRRARARPAAGRVRVRLLRTEPPRLAARGVPTRASRRSHGCGTTTRGWRPPTASPLFEPERLRETAAAADRVSLLLLPARGGAGAPAARRHQPRRGRGSADRPSSSTTWRSGVRRPGRALSSSTSPRATPATCSSRPAAPRRA